MASKIPRGLGDAVLEAKPLLGEGAALLENPLLKRVALGGDAIIDAAVLQTTKPDDVAAHAARKGRKTPADQEISSGDVKAAFNLVGNEQIKYKNKQGTLAFVGTEEMEANGSGEQSSQPNEPKVSILDQGVNFAHSALSYGFMGQMAIDLALPMIAAPFGWAKFTKVHSALNAPKHWVQKTQVTKNINLSQAINDGGQIAFNALATYGVAKGFGENMAALKEMYTDITGKEAPSTMQMLTGELPPLLAETRNHFIKEYGTRGLIQVAGWGLMIRDLMKAKFKAPKDIETMRIGLAAGMLPMAAGMGVDMLMGTSVTEVYSGFKKAAASGQPVGPNEYAAFLLASSPDLAKHKAGKQVAFELGEEYANQRTSPGEILRQMGDGRFNAKIEQIIARDEVMAQQQQLAETPAPAKELTMVEKLNGSKPQDRPKLGHFTGMVADKSNGISPIVTGP